MFCCIGSSYSQTPYISTDSTYCLTQAQSKHVLKINEERKALFLLSEKLKEEIAAINYLLSLKDEELEKKDTLIAGYSTEVVALQEMLAIKEKQLKKISRRLKFWRITAFSGMAVSLATTSYILLK